MLSCFQYLFYKTDLKLHMFALHSDFLLCILIDRYKTDGAGGGP